MVWPTRTTIGAVPAALCCKDRKQLVLGLLEYLAEYEECNVLEKIRAAHYRKSRSAGNVRSEPNKTELYFLNPTDTKGLGNIGPESDCNCGVDCSVFLRHREIWNGRS